MRHKARLVPIHQQITTSSRWHVRAAPLHALVRSKDGTIKRAYRLEDGQLIESVLMPYEDGR